MKNKLQESRLYHWTTYDQRKMNATPHDPTVHNDRPFAQVEYSRWREPLVWTPHLPIWYPPTPVSGKQPRL